MATENYASTKVTTGKVRFSFVNLFEPKAFGEGQPEKFSVMVLIPKSDVVTVKACKDAIDTAAKNALMTKFSGKMPAVLKTTFKDCDVDTDNDGEIFAEKWPYAAGHYQINVSTLNRPAIVDAGLQRVLDPTVVYSGCYGRVSINFFAYCFQGSKGISAGLNNVQFLEDGEPLGNVSSPEQDFA